MATTKNYGLAGIGADVQLGKGGGRLVFNTGAADFRVTTDGTTLAHIQVLDPVSATDAATKQYVDDRAAGLDPKASCTAATTGALAGASYTAGGGAGGTGQFTTAPATIDGVTVAQGDRILVKNQGTQTQNGIYVVTATTTTWDRASDFDSNAEVTAGAHTFIEEGTANANSGWVLQGPDPLTLNSSNLIFVLFSSSSDLIAGNGLVKNGNALDLDFSELTSASAIALADELIFQDGTVESRITVTNFLNDRDIPYGITTNGLLVRTAADTYTSRSVAASSVAGDEGISIVNGDGVSGNITIGIDILGQTNLTTDDVDDADELLMYHSVAGGTEGVGNYAITAAKLKTYMNAGTSSTSITEGNSTLSIADAGAGALTTNIDATDVIVTNVGSTTFQNGNDVVLNTGSTLTVTDLSADRVVFTTTAGLLTSNANYTFNGTTWSLTATANITGDLDVDNINLNGNAITITNTDGNLDLSANGTGDTRILDGAGNEIAEFLDGATAVNGLAFKAGATGVSPTIQLGTGAEANVDIGFLLNGTGVLSVTAGTGNYEDNVTADDDVPNKKYVDDAITNAAVAGGLDSVTATIPLTSAATVNIGAATGIPANCTIMSVTLDVTVASDAATTVTVGDATNGAASYMTATENDPATIGIYIADGRVLNGASARQATATVATPGTVGSATAIVTYRNA